MAKWSEDYEEQDSKRLLKREKLWTFLYCQSRNTEHMMKRLISLQMTEADIRFISQ